MKIPKMGLHKASGQARVTINGKTVYLGRFGSAKAKAKYDALIAEYRTNYQPPTPAHSPPYRSLVSNRPLSSAVCLDQDILARVPVNGNPEVSAGNPATSNEKQTGITRLVELSGRSLSTT